MLCPVIPSAVDSEIEKHRRRRSVGLLQDLESTVGRKESISHKKAIRHRFPDKNLHVATS